jgi:hypothetical protein
VREARPIYWLTGSIHSPETGSPEMLMELVYRLAVEESPLVRRVRAGVITLVTPVVEVDGRDRMVDVVALERSLKVGRGGVPLVYWGKYVAHDNNRDGLVNTLRLSQNINAGFLHWRPPCCTTCTRASRSSTRAPAPVRTTSSSTRSPSTSGTSSPTRRSTS